MAIVTARPSRRLHPTADPNIIPFIDVLLVLLIIFMVTAPKPTTDLRVDLPVGRSITENIAPTIVSVTQSGADVRILVDDEETNLSGLARRALAHALAADSALTAENAYSEARIYVRADLDVPYQSVVGVVDELQHARFRNVGIVTQHVDG